MKTITAITATLLCACSTPHPAPSDLSALYNKQITACVVRQDTSGMWLDIYTDFGAEPTISHAVRH
jgi:rhamnogalacturonyl hydrolase YesR